MALLAFAAGRMGSRQRNVPPASSIQKVEPPSSPPSSPSKAPWPQSSAKAPTSVPQTGPRGGKEPPKAVQKKAGQEERRMHEQHIAALRAERKQRLAEFNATQDPQARDVIANRIAAIDAEIKTRQQAIARLPK